MNDTISCPDCKSHDVQKIEKNVTQTESGDRGCKVVVMPYLAFSFCFLTLSGLALLIVGEFEFIVSGVIMALLGGIGTVYFFKKTKAIKLKSQSQTLTHAYYVCRSCGKEFL